MSSQRNELTELGRRSAQPQFFHKSRRNERRLWAAPINSAMRPENDFIEAEFRDNEERGVSKLRRVPLRVTGSTNTGVTPEQKESDCGERDKSLRVCPFE